MSEPNNANNTVKQTDSTSFASILAGVQRMRNEFGLTEPQRQKSATTDTVTSTASVETTNLPPEKPISNNKENRSSFTSNVNRVITNNTSIHRPRGNRPQTRISGPSEILVHKSQKGNPLFEDSLMKTAPWRFDEAILSDYYINPTLQILFLSLKYYKLHPEYIWQRLKKLNKGSIVNTNKDDKVLRILLTVVDIDSHQEVLCNLSDVCIKHDLSLVLAWSFEEAGNYIVFAKQLDNAPTKPKAAINGIKSSDYNSNVVEAFTSIKSVNKTDVSNLLANCKSVKNIIIQSCKSEEDNILHNISGLGSTKLNNLKRVFSEPFIYNKKYEETDTGSENI